jgi:preprotein translocase subunit SecG
MNTLENLVVVVQVVSALVIIGLVLLQHGKGADMGAAFGSGASGSLFGATGSSNFMSKSTGVAAAVFFASTLILVNFASKRNDISGGLVERAAATAPAQAPAAAGAIPTAPAPAPAAAVPAPAAPVTTAPATAPAPAPAAPGQVPK